MPTITHVKWDKFGFDYGFLFDISTPEELYDYWKRCRSSKLVEGFYDYLKAANQRGHITTGEASMLKAAAIVEAEKERPRSAIVLYADIMDEMFYQMQKGIQDNGRIYVNRNGGYFFPVKGMDTYDSKNIDEWVIPGEKIVVRRWPEGRHWYAYVGGSRVEMFGRSKWDTSAEATKLAKRWAKEHNIAVEEEA